MAKKNRRGEAERLLERRRQAINLRSAGFNYRQIAARLGVSVRTAYLDVQAVLTATRTETTETKDEMVLLERERLEAAHLVIWPRVLKGELLAIDRVLRISDAMRRLYGLDAPPNAGWYKAEAEAQARKEAEEKALNQPSEQELLAELTCEELELLKSHHEILERAAKRVAAKRIAAEKRK